MLLFPLLLHILYQMIFIFVIFLASFLYVALSVFKKLSHLKLGFVNMILVVFFEGTPFVFDKSVPFSWWICNVLCTRMFIWSCSSCFMWLMQHTKQLRSTIKYTQLGNVYCFDSPQFLRKHMQIQFSFLYRKMRRFPSLKQRKYWYEQCYRMLKRMLFKYK